MSAAAGQDPAVWVVTTTLPDEVSAVSLGRTLVERRLAACAQIEPIRSLYRWDGAVQDASEWRLVLKTTAAAWPALRAAIEALHPYEVPALHAVCCAEVHGPYVAWVRTEVNPLGEPPGG